MIKPRRIFFARPAALAAGLLAGLAAPGRAVFDLGVIKTAGFTEYTLSWTAVTPPVTGEKVSYHVFVSSGFISPFSAVMPTGVARNYLGAFFDVATGKLNLPSGTICFGLIATTASSQLTSPINTANATGGYDRSVVDCHSFLHCKGGQDSCVERSDGGNTQIGFGQKWNWAYNLDDDAKVTIKIYPEQALFYTDPQNGFSTTTYTSPTKVILSTTPRTGERNTGVSNNDSWDLRDPDGKVVANGLYRVHFEVTDPTLNLLTIMAGATRYADYFSIPVDVLRLMNFTTEGISPTSSLGKIKYDITGDATVRIVIAQPGRKFTLDGSKNVQSLNAAGSAIDTSTTSVVRVISFNKKATIGTSETWDGLDSLGVAVSSGLYTVGISAKDGFDNNALDSFGNDGPQATSIPVERTAAQTAADTTAPTISAITVNGTSIASGNPQFAFGTTFNSVVITLNETAGTGANDSIVSLSAPGASGGGTISNSAVTVTFTTATTQSSTGSYTVQVTAKDSLGNTATPQAFTFTIQPGGTAGTGTVARQTEDDFRKTVLSFPNPVRTGPATFAFDLKLASTVDLDLYTLTGERIFHLTQPFGAGANTFNWNLVNDGGAKIATGVYLLRITANDGANTVRASRKVMVIR